MSCSGSEEADLEAKAAALTGARGNGAERSSPGDSTAGAVRLASSQECSAGALQGKIRQTVGRGTKDGKTNQTETNIQSTGHEGGSALRGPAEAVRRDPIEKHGEVGGPTRHEGFNYQGDSICSCTYCRHSLCWMPNAAAWTFPVLG